MRFLLREIANQMVAQTRPLESASESLDEQARAERFDFNQPFHSHICNLMHKSVCLPTQMITKLCLLVD